MHVCKFIFENAKEAGEMQPFLTYPIMNVRIIVANQKILIL